MKIATYINQVQDIDELLSIQKDHRRIHEIIIAPKPLSRKGKLSIDEIKLIIDRLKDRFDQNTTRLVLEWDILMSEDEIDQSIQAFKSLSQYSFSAIRIQDPGALEFLLEETQFKIQWITEHGNHNHLGLKTWCDYIGARLERLIISQELSFEKIQAYQKELKVDLEILVLGKILLFYTPRSLLAPVFTDHDDHSTQEIQAIADSEESPHKGFHIVENQHGTFMYHLKDLCLINEAQKLNQLGEGVWGRIDTVFHKDLKFLGQALNLLDEFSEDSWNEFKEQYPVGLTKGFFLTNKTDVLFPKLKNHRLLRSDKSYVGEIADIVKGEYLVFSQKSRSNFLELGSSVQCTSPEGKQTQFTIDEISTLSGESCEQTKEIALYILKYRKGVVPRTVVNLTENVARQ